MHRASFATLAVGLSAMLIVLPGCGDSGSSPASEAQLEAAKREGEEAAREKDRIDDLQRQVRSLRRQAEREGAANVGRPAPSTSASAADGGGTTVLRSFHAPSGNVSCEISSDGARCSIASNAVTFTFAGGQPARVEPGATLPESAGELAPYGSTVSAGAITCTVPLSSEPHGVICADGNSGHGFEASRVAERQRVY